MTTDVISEDITISLATPEDADAVWEIFKHTVASGESYTYKPDTSREEAEAIWGHDPRTRYIARYKGNIGAFYDLKPNQRGLGSHIANAGYMVHPDFKNLGLGRAMVRHSLKQAKKAGFIAMQFNMVVSTNTYAVKTWTDAGFEIIGTIPKGYNHKQKGLVDAYIMYRSLDDIQ